MQRRTLLGVAAIATIRLPISTDGESEDTADDVHESPDLSNDHPNTRRMKGATGPAVKRPLSPSRSRYRLRIARAETSCPCSPQTGAVHATRPGAHTERSRGPVTPRTGASTDGVE